MNQYKKDVHLLMYVLFIIRHRNCLEGKSVRAINIYKIIPAKHCAAMYRLTALKNAEAFAAGPEDNRS